MTTVFFKKGVVLVLIILFIVASFVPEITGSIIEKTYYSEKTNSSNKQYDTKGSIIIEDILSPPTEGPVGYYEIIIRLSATGSSGEIILFEPMAEIFEITSGLKVYQGQSESWLQISAGSMMEYEFPIDWYAYDGEFLVEISIQLDTGETCDEMSKTVTFYDILPPMVETNNPKEITSISAVLQGTIIDDGGLGCSINFWYKEKDAITWSNLGWSPYYNHEGIFAETISELQPNTEYEYIFLAQNSEGTTLGDNKEFTTKGTIKVNYALTEYGASCHQGDNFDEDDLYKINDGNRYSEAQSLGWQIDSVARVEGIDIPDYFISNEIYWKAQLWVRPGTGSNYVHIFAHTGGNWNEVDVSDNFAQGLILSNTVQVPNKINMVNIEGDVGNHVTYGNTWRFFEVEVWAEVPDVLTCTAYCPIDLIVTDPNGKIINKTYSEIINATYIEDDFNSDGELDDQINIYDYTKGNYSIEVIPELDSDPNENYSLEIMFRGEIIFETGEKNISDIPTEPYECLVNIRPEADFSFYPEEINEMDLIQFTDNSTDLDGSIVNWSWDFGDGNISYEQNPTHQYIYSTTYTVCLIVTDELGKSSLPICKNIIVSEIDVNQGSFDIGFPIRHAIDGNWGAAQSFLPTLNTLSSTEIYMRKFGTPEFNLTVELRSDHPQGTLIDTLFFAPDEVPSFWIWFPLDFTDTPITPETQYFIVIPPAPSGVTTSFGYEWGYAFGDQYDDGAFWFTRDGGGLWRDLPTMYEFCFRTYGYD